MIAGRKAYWNSIGTKEALHGSNHAPTDVIVETRNHINAKYGIKARVISSKSNYEWEGFDFIIPHKEYSGTYSMQMEYEGKQFNVYMDSNGKIKDNYQHEEINEYLQKYVSSYMPECDFKVLFKYSLLDKYVDTSDIEKCFNEHDITVMIYVIGEEIQNERFDEIKEFARNSKTRFSLNSCRTEHDRETLMKEYASGISSSYAMQVQSVWYCNYDSRTDTHTENDTEYELGQHDKLYYTIPDSGEVKITDLRKKVYETPKASYPLLTPAFQIECDDDVTLFYPVSDSKQLGDYETYKNYGGNEAEVIDGYYVCTFHSQEWYQEHYMISPYKGDSRIFGIYMGKQFYE